MGAKAVFSRLNLLLFLMRNLCGIAGDSAWLCGGVAAACPRLLQGAACNLRRSAARSSALRGT